jgi:hypothetical protein
MERFIDTATIGIVRASSRSASSIVRHAQPPGRTSRSLNARGPAVLIFPDSFNLVCSGMLSPAPDVRELEHKASPAMDTLSTQDSYPKLPNRFGPKVAAMPERSYGATRVTLVLRDVIIGADKIGQRLIQSESDLDFSVSDIEHVERG